MEDLKGVGYTHLIPIVKRAPKVTFYIQMSYSSTYIFYLELQNKTTAMLGSAVLDNPPLQHCSSNQLYMREDLKNITIYLMRDTIRG